MCCARYILLNVPSISQLFIKTMNTRTTILDTVVLFISQLGEVKRSTDLLAFMELTFGIIAHPLLCLLVSICFTSMFKHCYMPQSMINTVIIPIIKTKSGDFTDKNNYRPIALSSIVSKVFEHTIVIRLEEYLWTNDN